MSGIIISFDHDLIHTELKHLVKTVQKNFSARSNHLSFYRFLNGHSPSPSALAKRMFFLPIYGDSCNQNSSDYSYMAATIHKLFFQS